MFGLFVLNAIKERRLIMTDQKYISQKDYGRSKPSISNRWTAKPKENQENSRTQYQHVSLTPRKVKDEWVEDALEYLATAAEPAARATAMRERADNVRKEIRARLTLSLDNPEKSATMRESWALCHDDYMAACREFEAALEEERRHYRMHSQAESIISAWQTEERVIRDAEKIR